MNLYWYSSAEYLKVGYRSVQLKEHPKPKSLCMQVNLWRNNFLVTEFKAFQQLWWHNNCSEWSELCVIWIDIAVPTAFIWWFPFLCPLTEAELTVKVFAAPLRVWLDQQFVIIAVNYRILYAVARGVNLCIRIGEILSQRNYYPSSLSHITEIMPLL